MAKTKAKPPSAAPTPQAVTDSETHTLLQAIRDAVVENTAALNEANLHLTDLVRGLTAGSSVQAAAAKEAE